MGTTKLIPELKHTLAQECLSKLHIPSLVYRHQRGEMILLYQLTYQYFNIGVSSL